MSEEPALGPLAALEEIAFRLETRREATYRVTAFRRAAEIVRDLPPHDLAALASTGALETIDGIGPSTAAVIEEALAGATPAYLQRLRGDEIDADPDSPGGRLRSALRGDCHSHTDWSDGGSPLETMARTARDLGHEYLVVTDHSPRLKVANGLTVDRLARQIDDITALNEQLAPFRVLRGVEVDILDDGSLDHPDEVLALLDVVVASIHSGLRDDADTMTRRLVAAVENPHMDILGHCTGRLVVGKGRPESQFDAGEVFGAIARHDKALEVNSRPERLDPPRRLLAQAREHGCRVAIDSDAHAPGQLAWQRLGCDRAAGEGFGTDTVVNTMPAGELLAWAAAHADPSGAAT